MLKRILCSLGLCCLLATASLLLTTPAAAATYTDLSGCWAGSVIEKWSDTGILSGYPDGTFRPNNPVTRAQLATVLYRIWGSEPVQGGFSYPDLPKSLWCYDALNTTNLYGVSLPTVDNMLPDQPLTREEAFYMIARGFLMSVNPLSRKDALDRISDSADISPQYVQAVKWLMIDGYVNGSADGKLHPKRSITRAEIMKIIDNIVHVYITKPGTYQVHAKENVLITCGGVTLQRTDVPENYVNLRRTSYVRNFLFGSAAAQGGVTFENHMAGDQPSTFYLYFVSQQDPTWTADARCNMHTQRAETFSAASYPFPDTRFTSGFGTADFPYLIGSADQFRLLAECQEDTPLRSKRFRLLRDLDLGTLSGPLGGEGDGRVFAYLDGGGHTVTYQMPAVTLHRNAAGLFCDWSGDVSNLRLSGMADVTFAPDAPGQPQSIVLGDSGLAFGGFSGYFGGKLANCTTAMDLTVRFRGQSDSRLLVGGWAGYSRGKGFRDCLASGSVKVLLDSETAYARVGGLLGLGGNSSRDYIEVARCGASGSVSVQGGYYTMSGGLAGQFNSAYTYYDPGRTQENWTLLNCWSTASASSGGARFQSEVGGLVGQLYSGFVRESWAKPSLSIRGGEYQNLGGIAGSCRTLGSITDCWVNAANCQAAGGDVHVGGITGRLDQGTVSRCYTLGATALGSGNAIAYQSWNDGSVTASTDMTGIAKSVRDLFYQNCGWDFAAVWDKSGAYPILRNCNAAQRAAQ